LLLLFTLNLNFVEYALPCPIPAYFREIRRNPAEVIPSMQAIQFIDSRTAITQSRPRTHELISYLSCIRLKLLNSEWPVIVDLYECGRV